MSLEDVMRRVKSDIRLLEEFRSELKWLDRGLKGEKMRVIARGKVVKEDPEPVKRRALQALERLSDPKFSELLKRYGVELPRPEDITKNY